MWLSQDPGVLRPQNMHMRWGGAWRAGSLWCEPLCIMKTSTKKADKGYTNWSVCDAGHFSCKCCQDRTSWVPPCFTGCEKRFMLEQTENFLIVLFKLGGVWIWGLSKLSVNIHIFLLTATLPSLLPHKTSKHYILSNATCFQDHLPPDVGLGHDVLQSIAELKEGLNLERTKTQTASMKSIWRKIKHVNHYH